MTVHIGNMTSELSVASGDLPLTAAQIEKVAKIVKQHLDAWNRDAEQQRDATRLRPSVAPPTQVD